MAIQSSRYRGNQATGINDLQLFRTDYGSDATMARARRNRLYGAEDQALQSITNLYQNAGGEQAINAPAVMRSEEGRRRLLEVRSRLKANAIAQPGGTLNDSYYRGQAGAAEGAYAANSADAYAQARAAAEQQKIALAQALYAITNQARMGAGNDYMGAQQAGQGVLGQQIAGWGDLAGNEEQIAAQNAQIAAQQKAMLMDFISKAGGLYGMSQGWGKTV